MLAGVECSLVLSHLVSAFSARHFWRTCSSIWSSNDIRVKVAGGLIEHVTLSRWCEGGILICFVLGMYVTFYICLQFMKRCYKNKPTFPKRWRESWCLEGLCFVKNYLFIENEKLTTVGYLKTILLCHSGVSISVNVDSSSLARPGNPSQDFSIAAMTRTRLSGLEVL